MQTRNTFPPALQSLQAFNLHDDHDKRHVLLRVMSDLFAACPAPTPEDCSEYEAMALALVEHVDHGTRAAVAHAITVMPVTPQALVDRLMALGGDAAAHLLEHCPTISPERLADFVVGAPSHLVVLAAGREDIDLATARAIAKRTEPAIAMALLANPHTPMDRVLYLTLLPRARRDAALAKLLAPHAPSAEEAMPLFLSCSGAMRTEILRHARLMGPHAAPQDKATAYEEAALAQIETLAGAGDAKAFCAHLAQTMGHAKTDMARILADPTGEASVILFAALGLPGPTVGRMMLTSSCFPHLPANAVHDLISLMGHLPQRVAQKLMAAMCEPHLEVRRSHHPNGQPAPLPVLVSQQASPVIRPLQRLRRQMRAPTVELNPTDQRQAPVVQPPQKAS